MKVLILAGGGGTRLFPLSRDDFPKQFLKLTDNESLLQKTVKRALKIVGTLDNIIFLTNKNYLFTLKQQVYESTKMYPKHFILEPERRNTAPAIALGVKYILENEIAKSDEPLLILPSDHIIQPEKVFIDYVKTADQIAKKGYIVTFGIIPIRVETGYGYIEADKNERIGEFEAYKVKKFHEKPSFEIAKEYIESSNFYWNSGMFVFTPEVFLEELKKYAPPIYESLQGKSFEEVLNTFGELPDISIDYAIMEKTEKAVVQPLNISWSDVGSFEALYEVLKKDDKGNVLKGKVYTFNTQNSLILGNKRLVSVIGIEDIILVETEDVVLVAKKGEGQKIKELYQSLKENPETKNHTEAGPMVYRPWGSYTVLEEGERYKIKRITVNPGETLSLQMHYHRSEHWIVVKGTALVIIENEDGNVSEVYVHENESFFVPKTKKHRLINPGKIPLEIIEVQVGEYLEEDDIVRFDDIYGRIE